MRVLVVDDDMVVQRHCREMLEAEGFEVVCESSLGSARRFLRHNRADTLLLDLFLPDGCGYELFKTSPQLLEGVPVVGMTSVYQGSANARLLTARHSFVSVLSKPVRSAALVEVLRGVFDERYPRSPELVRSMEESTVVVPVDRVADEPPAVQSTTVPAMSNPLPSPSLMADFVSPLEPAPSPLDPLGSASQLGDVTGWDPTGNDTSFDGGAEPAQPVVRPTVTETPRPARHHASSPSWSSVDAVTPAAIAPAAIAPAAAQPEALVMPEVAAPPEPDMVMPSASSLVVPGSFKDESIDGATPAESPAASPAEPAAHMRHSSPSLSAVDAIDAMPEQRHSYERLPAISAASVDAPAPDPFDDVPTKSGTTPVARLERTPARRGFNSRHIRALSRSAQPAAPFAPMEPAARPIEATVQTRRPIAPVPQRSFEPRNPDLEGLISPVNLDPRRVPLQGLLEETPFPSILTRLARAQVTGSLLLKRDKIKKMVFIENGVPRGIKSNLLYECLGQILVRDGLLDEARCQLSVDRLKAERRLQGEILVEMGVLSPAHLKRCLERQFDIKLLDVAGWERGIYQFRAMARLRDMPRIELRDPNHIVMLCVRNGFPAERISIDLAPYMAYAPVLLVGHSELADLELTESERDWMRLLDNRRTLGNILNITGGAEGVYKLFYALNCLGLMAFRSPEPH